MLPIRVDFYLLKDNQPQAHWLVICRLIEKAYYKGHQIYVFCEDQQQAEQLDELLWTFKEDSFIPHNLQGEGPEPPPPIQIGYQKEPRGFNDILFNLSAQVPSFFNKFKRVLEVVAPQEEKKEQSRVRYREYKLRGCQLTTHEL